jgi:expansin (peptidoglycan-binding protein)
MRALLPLLLVTGCGGGGSPGADAAGCEREGTHEGEATYYDADGSGNCSFEPSPDDLLVAAANSPDYAGSAACGACARVDGPDGSVTVRIVDQCPGCAAGDLDLSPQAFERIAPLKQGRVPITWRYVPCDVSGPVRYRFKDGSNPFWTALQVRNHRYRIALLQARPAGGEWRTVARESYNYFVDAAGLGDGPIDLLLMDVHGHMVIDSGIVPGDDVERSGAAQLDLCDPP